MKLKTQLKLLKELRDNLEFLYEIEGATSELDDKYLESSLNNILEEVTRLIERSGW